MKFGTALHVAINNEDFPKAMRVLKKLISSNDFNGHLDLNKTDEDGNSPLHLAMKKFNSNVSVAIKLTKMLIKNGASLNLKNSA